MSHGMHSSVKQLETDIEDVKEIIFNLTSEVNELKSQVASLEQSVAILS